MGYVDDTTICAVIPKPLLRPQVMDSLNQDLATIDCWSLKWHRLNPKKTEPTVASRSWINASSYGDLNFGGVKLEGVKSSYR